MILGKRTDPGRTWERLSVGDRTEEVRKVHDKDLLLYLGATDNTNPLFLQSQYAEQTPYSRLLVPVGLLTGWVESILSEKLPGAGSLLREQRLSCPKPAWLGSTLRLELELTYKDREQKWVTFSVRGTDGEGRKVLEGEVDVIPPQPRTDWLKHAYENF
ncbi:acyl dehydratase [Melghirimyces profundicolus]|uniref:Acyl dehydratase n=1 Tax=Melghirimyces profundicolus TaxID=1242148 RepID=A0A2T6C4I0_9BACL|nr:enoyl-CoA hydratase [Melghirimyces profundicolus]PTX63224.1 acyl dehydratase [Melghirimyces profundicolus]